MKVVKIKSQKINDENLKIYSYENLDKTIKKDNFIKKCCKCDKINLICFILFILSFILYLHSLKGCFENEYECLTKKKIKEYYILGIETLFSSFFFSILLFISIILKIFKLFFYFIPFIIVFILTQGNDLKNHGTFNMIGFFLFLFFFLVIMFILYILLLKIYSKQYKLTFIYILFICLLILIFSIIHSYSCKNFDKGLGNIKIINNKNEDLCYFIKPKKCDIPLLDWILSSSIFLNNCKGKSNDKQSFTKMLKKMYKVKFDLNKNEFYFPNTENFTFKDSLLNIFNKCVLKNITTKKIDKTNDQVSIKFNKNKGNININLNYNETLVNERRKIAKLNSVKYENIFFIYIDSLSRQNFQRKLKKTSKLLNYLIMNNNQKFNLEQYEKYNFTNINSYQFLKYHSLGENTPYNIFPMFFGNPYKYKGGREILYDLSKKGYITASTGNSCSREPLNLYNRYINKHQFYNSDYENFGIFCDPHYYNPKDSHSMYMGVNSKYRRCLYGKDSFEYLFEFTLKFLELYKNERKFFRIISNDGHEGNLKIIKYIDEPLHDFLINLLTNYFDDKSIIFIASDHGSSMNGFYELILSEDKMLEIFFPTLFILLPKNSTEIEKKNLEYNVQKMITSYDIYATLFNILYMNEKNFNLKKNYQGQSLFTKIDGLKRSCKNYKELNGENSDYCKCYLYE